jgi:hypothetical protein
MAWSAPMNFFRMVVALVFLVLGLLIGLHSSTPLITLEFFSLAWATTPGNAIIFALFASVLIGGVILLTRRRLGAVSQVARIQQASRRACTCPGCRTMKPGI